MKQTMKRLFSLFLLFACFAHLHAMEKQEKLNQALVNAAEDRNIQKVEELLDQGADINARCWDTPLTAATLSGSIPLVTLLLKRGAQVNKKDAVYDTPLLKALFHWIELRGTFTEIIKLLLQYGANPNIPSTNGNTPLHWAARKGQRATVALLLLCGADPNIKNLKGRTPYQEICQPEFQRWGRTWMHESLEDPQKTLEKLEKFLDTHPKEKERLRPMFIGRACTTRSYKPNSAGMLTMLRDRQIGRKNKK